MQASTLRGLYCNSISRLTELTVQEELNIFLLADLHMNSLSNGQPLPALPALEAQAASASLFTTHQKHG